MFRTQIRLRVERLRVHFDIVGGSNDPVLFMLQELDSCFREKSRNLTSPSDDFGTGRFGNVTSASLTSIASSGGTSSSSYSKACRLSLSGDGSRSESGPDAVGDSGAGTLEVR